MTTSHSEDSRPYPVVEVRPEWTLDDEMRGGREKFWYEVPDDGQRWLFKFFREPIARAVARRSQFAELVERVPDDWMSRPAKEFSEALLDYNATELERCLK